MRALQCLSVTAAVGLACAAGWRADAHRVAALVFLAALAIPALLLAGLAGRRWAGLAAGVAAIGLTALTGIAWPTRPSLGWVGLGACHAAILLPYLVFLGVVLRRSFVRQKVDESFMRLDLWWINAGLVGFVFLFGVAVMERGAGLRGLATGLARGLPALSGVCLFLMATRTVAGEAGEDRDWAARLLPVALGVACLVAVALPVGRGALAWRALDKADWHAAMNERDLAREWLGRAEKHNADLRWPALRERRKELAEKLGN